MILLMTISTFAVFIIFVTAMHVIVHIDTIAAQITGGRVKAATKTHAF
jgi:hypothetical protein